MGKTYVDKNCLHLSSASALLPPGYYGYHGSHHSGMAELRYMAIADWSRSIHLTKLCKSKPLPGNFGSESKKAISLQMAACPRYKEMEEVRQQKKRQRITERGRKPSWVLVPSSRGS